MLSMTSLALPWGHSRMWQAAGEMLCLSVCWFVVPLAEHHHHKLVPTSLVEEVSRDVSNVVSHVLEWGVGGAVEGEQDYNRLNCLQSNNKCQATKEFSVFQFS